jgi:hypothetical protein
MQRINLVALALIGVLSLTGAAASSASASLCRKVHEAHTGNFSDRGCTHSETNGEYLLVESESSRLIERDGQCVKGHFSGGGTYNEECITKVAGGEYGYALKNRTYIEIGVLSVGSKAPLAPKAVADEHAVLNVPGIKLKATCASLEDNAGALVGENNIEASALKFGGCSEIEPSTCRLTEPTIQTEPVLATLSMGAPFPADRVLLAPQTKTALATVDFEGSCSFAGEKLVTGEVNIEAPTGQEELTGQAIEGLGSVENNSLMIAGNKAFLEKGKALLKLSSGSKFSFF